MDIKIIEEVKEIVKDACYKDTNKFGPGIWNNHIVEVVKYADKLSSILRADKEIVLLAAYLHDYAGIKNYNFYKDHHVYGALEAERILSRLKYDRTKLEKVKEAIYTHRASVSVSKSSIESICLASADAMAHISEFISLLKYAKDIKNMDTEVASLWVNEKLNRSWNKTCKEGRILIEENYQTALNYLENIRVA